MPLSAARRGLDRRPVLDAGKNPLSVPLGNALTTDEHLSEFL
jgi:hypothetical protein